MKKVFYTISSSLRDIFDYLLLFARLTFLIIVHFFTVGFSWLLQSIPTRATKTLARIIKVKSLWLLSRLDHSEKSSISRLNLVDLSMRNLASKKTRTLITVGGMAVGIGSIVFLVSIGYGLQELVISRVARLEELQQAEVTAQPNSQLSINDEVISNILNLSEIDQVLPLISVVGKVSYQEAVTDMAVYGVTTQYLASSAIQPSRGSLFESNDIATIITEPLEQAQLADNLGVTNGVILGTASFGSELERVMVEIDPNIWVRVRSGPSTEHQVLGYTKARDKPVEGWLVWGKRYLGAEIVTSGDGRADQLSHWISAEVPLWQTDDQEEYEPILNDQGEHLSQSGYMAQLNMQLLPAADNGRVLGETDELSQLTQANGDWVEIASESGKLETVSVQRLSLGSKAKKQAVINRAALNVLGISEEEAVGEKFEASFIVMGRILEQPGEKIESIPAEYEIIGVIPGDQTPLFYVPFTDLRSLGIVNYSQAKIISNEQAELSAARQKIEAFGFVTRSVVDTVDQIESIFATTRLLLSLLGLSALLVASLGMFNTLTVSLLERTREVGLMKALGMKSKEVKELFLIESLTMGLLGGFAGVLLGYLAGKIISVFLSAFSVAQGVGVMNISVIPLGFVFVVIFLAILVGIVTGLYPAKRARHISALNALRYE